MNWSFEEAKYWYSIIHYCLFIGFFTIIILVKNKGVFNSIIRFYVVVIIWASICYINNGCPLTYLENYISCRNYGMEFYQDYGFDQTDVKILISYPQFWYPLFIASFIKYTTDVKPF